jgi:hypothetical protein
MPNAHEPRWQASRRKVSTITIETSPPVVEMSESDRRAALRETFRARGLPIPAHLEASAPRYAWVPLEKKETKTMPTPMSFAEKLKRTAAEFDLDVKVPDERRRAQDILLRRDPEATSDIPLYGSQALDAERVGGLRVFRALEAIKRERGLDWRRCFAAAAAELRKSDPALAVLMAEQGEVVVEPTGDPEAELNKVAMAEKLDLANPRDLHRARELLAEKRGGGIPKYGSRT